MQTPHIHIDDFLPAALAEAMRGDFDAHFAQPERHGPDQQIWNYWYVPPIYTYLRTQPEKVIADDPIRQFRAALGAWARETLGMTRITWPNLSLYVDGCQQGLHNDSVNGRFGYVFSLTRDVRRTSGGETIVLREGDLFRGNLGNAAAGRDLYDLIAPRFNRLALFDDRMPHGVSRVEGSMDPVEGRVVLHGHISEGGGFADGALDFALVVQHLQEPIRRALPAEDMGWRGPLVLRVLIDPDGAVRDIQTLVSRIARADGESPAALIDGVLSSIRETVFPSAPETTRATVPLIFGNTI